MHLLIVLVGPIKKKKNGNVQGDRDGTFAPKSLKVPLRFTVALIGSCLHKLYTVEKATQNRTGQASVSTYRLLHSRVQRKGKHSPINYKTPTCIKTASHNVSALLLCRQVMFVKTEKVLEEEGVRTPRKSVGVF